MKKVFLTVFLIILSIVSFSKVYVYKGVVVFEYNDLTASSVYLAGSFNNWDSTALLMKKVKGGLWRTMLKLSPGDYQYKFVINGTDWKEDPEAPDYAPDGFGGKNGAFSLVLENGELKIKKAVKQESGINGIISGSYAFDLKSKIDADTYSLKAPTLNHIFNLTISPKKSGMKFEANLSADNSSWQLKLNSLKALWNNSNITFGVYKNATANELINFNENMELYKTGFFSIVDLNLIKAGIDIYSENNELKYFVSTNLILNDILISSLYVPATENSTMNLYMRAETRGFGLEVKYTDAVEYIKSDYSSNIYSFIFTYNLLSKEILLNGNYGNVLQISGDYNIENNVYSVEADISFNILNELTLLTDLYYDNFNNIGYKFGFGMKKNTLDISFKVGNDFEDNFEDYYLSVSASAEF